MTQFTVRRQNRITYVGAKIRERAKRHMRKEMTRGFGGFALISLIGWVLDLCLTMGLVQLGLSPFLASLCGAATAVTFVYATSRLTLLGDRKIGGAQDFGLYVAWQVVAISIASALVAIIARTLDPILAGFGGLAAGQLNGIETLTLASGLAKGLVTPLTLLANFLFMKWLAEHRGPATMSGKGVR